MSDCNSYGVKKMSRVEFKAVEFRVNASIIHYQLKIIAMLKPALFDPMNHLSFMPGLPGPHFSLHQTLFGARLSSNNRKELCPLLLLKKSHLSNSVHSSNKCVLGALKCDLTDCCSTFQEPVWSESFLPF